MRHIHTSLIIPISCGKEQTCPFSPMTPFLMCKTGTYGDKRYKVRQGYIHIQTRIKDILPPYAATAIYLAAAERHQRSSSRSSSRIRARVPKARRAAKSPAAGSSHSPPPRTGFGLELRRCHCFDASAMRSPFRRGVDIVRRCCSENK